jgi:hypothetical protein
MYQWNFMSGNYSTTWEVPNFFSEFLMVCIMFERNFDFYTLYVFTDIYTMDADSPPTVSRYDSFEEGKVKCFKIRMLTIRLFVVQVPGNVTR